MKETVKVNISSLLFDLDVDAYDRLRAYLDSLHKKFDKENGDGAEIIEDIESRIAELLNQKIGDRKKVITLADINEIISQLGTAEEMETEEEETEKSAGESSAKEKYSHSGKKRLYRDGDHKVIAGVSSGIAAYFGIDVVWMRIIFVVLFFASIPAFPGAVIIYIILWIVIPEAVTTAQKLEMQGKPVNINNIQESVKEEYHKVKDSAKNFTKSKTFKNTESAFAEFFKVLGNILVVLLKIIGVFIIVSLIVGFVILIFRLLMGGSVHFPFRFFYGFRWPGILHFPDLTLTGFLLFLVIAIPLLALFVRLVRLIFGLQSTNHVGAGIGATIWVIALISLILVGISDSDGGQLRRKQVNVYEIEIDPKEVLELDVNHVIDFNKSDKYYQVFGYQLANNDDILYRQPKIIIEESFDDKIHLVVSEYYFSLNNENSWYYDNLIEYNWHISDSKLVLDDYIKADERDGWRLPKVNITLRIPDDVKIKYTPDFSLLIKRIEGLESYKIDNYENKAIEIPVYD